MCVLVIYGTALGSPTPPPGDGHGSLPRPLWEWVGWLWMGGMLVDGVVVFANDVESYGICKELY